MRKLYKKGFSVSELVLVIAILGIMTTIAVVRFSTINNKKTIENGAEDIVTTLNKASSKSLASVDSLNYGVHFEPEAIVIFTGTTYPGSLNASGNETYIPIRPPASITNVTLNGVSSTSGELYFNRLTGIPSKTGTITVSTPEYSKVITIGATGILSRGPIIDAAEPTYSLNLTLVGSASRTTSSPAGIDCISTLGCSSDFPAGTSVVLTAGYSASYVLTAWIGDCDSTGGTVQDPTCTVVMDSDKNITAEYGYKAAPVR